MIQYKDFSGNIIKDVDVKQGIVTGYFSVFGNVDSDGDMIMPGSFAKTISENGPEAKNRIAHLWQHKSDEPIGKPSVLKEDTYGLYFESKIVSTTRGADAIKLYAAGVINEHSIGFNTVKKEQKSGYMELTELKLWEGSTVTWGANEQARATGMKSMNVIEKANRRAVIYAALRNGSFEDQTFELLIKELEFLDQEIKADDATTQPVDTTKSEQVDTSLLVYINLITKDLNGF